MTELFEFNGNLTKLARNFMPPAEYWVCCRQVKELPQDRFISLQQSVEPLVASGWISGLTCLLWNIRCEIDTSGLLATAARNGDLRMMRLVNMSAPSDHETSEALTAAISAENINAIKLLHNWGYENPDALMPHAIWNKSIRLMKLAKKLGTSIENAIYWTHDQNFKRGIKLSKKW